MIRIKGKSWSLRGGLFAKYVTALVGLVVFVLAVNGATETWISYRAIKSALTDTMGEKADSTAQRILQSIDDLQRQISWITRASAVTTEQHNADYSQLLNQVPAVDQLMLLDGSGREKLRRSHAAAQIGSHIDLSRDPRFTESHGKSVSYGAATFRDMHPYMSISMVHSGFNADVTIADIDLRFLSDLLAETQIGRSNIAYVVDPHGEVLASSNRGPAIGKSLARLPQVDAALKAGTVRSDLGTDFEGHSMLTAASVVPTLGWYVFFEQPTSQAMAPIREQLLRGAVLIALGLVLAILAGMAMARRMLIPITALRRGARRLGEGKFDHRIDVKTGDELEELADQFNSMAGQLAETYAGLGSKVEERTRDLAQSINELKVLEQVGRALSSSLDLNAVLPKVAEHALDITEADAVLIYGYDATKHQFQLAGSIGIDDAGSGRRHAIDETATVLGDAARSGEPIVIADLSKTAEILLQQMGVAADFHSVLVAPLVDQKGVLGSLVVLRRVAGAFSPNLVGLMRTFAHQAVLAMRNARLFTEVDQKGRELTAAHAIQQQQAAKLEAQTEQLKNWNKSLEERVETQLGEIERIRKLERFLAPQVAQLIASSDGHDALLDSHRREVTVVFCDLRGFTAFTESTEPEEAMNVLREYHAALGELTFKYEGTLDRYAGDGVMILFNAPIQFADHTERAVRMAIEMRDVIGELTVRWRNRGHSLGFGVGVALGFATIGQIGFEHRLEYGAIGSVTNLASRLCDEAKANQIVVSRRVFGLVERWVEGRPLDDFQLKGFNHPVLAAEILRLRQGVETKDMPAAS